MRSYRSFTLPGIDMLCSWREYNTAKQTQSAVRQFGSPGMMSELYGVTNWDFPFSGHKNEGDWQAALGVTVRVHHLSWVSMAGEAKRDYPASISYQSPWYKEYPIVENHFARLNTVLTRGKPVVRVGMIHPIESYWLCFGPQEQTGLERAERQENFANLTEWLLFGLIDFDFISESLLPLQNHGQEGDAFQVGEMSYELVLVPGMRTIRSSTLERLEALVEAGGQVMFIGEIPSLVDAVPSDRVRQLAARCQQVSFSKAQVLTALEARRDIKSFTKWDKETLLYQLRRDGDTQYLFVCNTDHNEWVNNTRIKIKGEWNPTLLDTLSGERRAFAATVENGWTVFKHVFTGHGHLLLELEPGAPQVEALPELPRRRETVLLQDPVPVTLSEPNVLLLDIAEYRIDGGEWQAREEVLRVENVARKRWNLPLKGGEVAQTWTDTEPAVVVGQLELRYTFNSEVEVAAPQLAIESPETVQVLLDGQPVESGLDSITGWWVDEAIKTVVLPSFGPGTHELIIKIPFTRRTNVEWCYVLGDFGVQVYGRHPKIVAPVRELTWGDWTRQGLAFYAGNVTYHCEIEVDGEGNGDGQGIAVEVPHFKAPILTVEINGKPTNPIAFSPYRAELGVLNKGRHKVDITAYGNRINAFGSIHNTYRNEFWYGPSAWRSSGATTWAYEYQLKPTGILTAPVLLEAKP